ncbi:protocadherin beta-15-like isoform X1 [Argonauta hians]
MIMNIYVGFLLLNAMTSGFDLSYRVKEDQNVGIYVGDLATDTNLLDKIAVKDRTSIWFSQLHQKRSDSNSHLFNISKSGEIYTAQTLDAESLCKYNTVCFKMVDIAVQNQLAFIKILEMKIIIEDVNDNYPEFPTREIVLQFSEADKKGTSKPVPNAIDRDVDVLNSQIKYRLKKQGNEPFMLSIVKKVDGSAKLGIVLEQGVDRETKDNYILQIIAEDQGMPPKSSFLNVKISIEDENDNSPVFDQNIYNVSINNNYQRNLPILHLTANDLDIGNNGNVSYRFGSKTSKNDQIYFKIIEATGEIFLQKNFLQRTKKVYKLFVEATDGGHPPLSSTAIVLVHVVNQQNNAPVIDMNFISRSKENNAMVSEAIKVGGFIAFVKVTDEDVGKNSEVSCDLQHEKLQLRSLGKNKYKIVVKNLINRETESYIESTIFCEDNGSPPMKTERKFSIQVEDVNDIQPQFTKSTFKFLTYENESPNFPVGFVNATDSDLGPGGQLSFYLFNERGIILPFKISGFGFISATQTLDRERQNVYNFKVLVKDNGTPSLNNTANVIIEVMDKNDNPPYFTFPSANPFNLDVHYHPQSKSGITTLRASDRDSHVNSFLRYEIFGGNDKQLFKVNPYTGVLSFSRTVYQNDAGSYNLVLAVKDNGTPVLSATTTLSLSLTVSNTTARMYTAEDTESDNRIHINLMIIIVVAAVIVSVAIVVSIIVCIIHKKNQKENHYGATQDYVGERRPSRYVCEQDSPKYDVPVAILSDPKQQGRNTQSNLIRHVCQPDYNPGQSWKGSSPHIQVQNRTADSRQSLDSGHHVAPSSRLLVDYNDPSTLSGTYFIDLGRRNGKLDQSGKF